VDGCDEATEREATLVSLPMRDRAGSFSVVRLLEFLTALGQDVEIRVRPTRKAQGEMSVRLG